MNVNEIGQNAGTIWNELNNNGALTYEQLKRTTRLTDFALFAAIGWLARENKLKVSGNTVRLND